MSRDNFETTGDESGEKGGENRRGQKKKKKKIGERTARYFSYLTEFFAFFSTAQPGPKPGVTIQMKPLLLFGSSFTCYFCLVCISSY